MEQDLRQWRQQRHEQSTVASLPSSSDHHMNTSNHTSYMRANTNDTNNNNSNNNNNNNHVQDQYTIEEMQEMLEFMRLRLSVAQADLERGHRREDELLRSIEELRHRIRQQRPPMNDAKLQLLEERIIELNDQIVEYDCETRVMIKLTRNTMYRMDQIMKRAAAVSVASSVTEEALDMETASMVTRIDELSMAESTSIATKTQESLERQTSGRSMSTTGGNSINSNESASSQIRLGPAAA